MTSALAAIDLRTGALAVVTVAASVVLGVPWLHAALGGLAVLVFGLALGRVAHRSGVARPTAHAATGLRPTIEEIHATEPRPAIDPRPTTTDLSAPYGRLTTRELEIAVFVAKGHTNREIADRLVLSERTIDNHLQHVMDKLGVHRRSQVSAWIAERGLLPKDRA